MKNVYVAIGLSVLIFASGTYWVIQYNVGPKFTTAAAMTNPLALSDDAPLPDVLERLQKLQEINPDLVVSITTNTFHGANINVGKPPVRLAWYDSVFAQVARNNRLWGSSGKVILSVDKFTKKTGRSSSLLRDVRYTECNILERPTKQQYSDSTCKYLLQWEAAHNQLLPNNVLRVVPPVKSDLPNQQRKKRVVIRVDVPETDLNKWVRLSFDLFKSAPANSFVIKSIRVYGDEAQTWRISWGDDFARKAPTNNTNYSYSVPEFLHYVTEFHTWVPSLWVRIDYAYDVPTDSMGYVEFRNLKLQDSFILDDERDGKIPSSQMQFWNSLDLTDSWKAQFGEANIPPDKWAQGYAFGTWKCPMVNDCTIALAFRQMDWVDSLYGDRPEWGGFMFEWDEHYGPSGRGVYYDSLSSGEMFGWHAALVSKHIDDLNKKRFNKGLSPILGYAFGDMLVPYHGGKQFYQGNDPEKGGMSNIPQWYFRHGGVNNIYWIEWGGHDPATVVAFRDSLGMPWMIGFCRDADQNAEEYPSVPPMIKLVGEKSWTYCKGGFEFGWWPHWYSFCEPVDSLMRETHRQLRAYQERKSVKQTIKLK